MPSGGTRRSRPVCVVIDWYSWVDSNHRPP